MPTMPIITEFRNVEFGYKRQYSNLIKNVTFELKAGEVVLLTGPNGSGKSTLIGLVSGRLSPNSGTIRVFGKNPFNVSRASGIGIITEPFHPYQSPLPVNLTIKQIFNWLQILDGVSYETITQYWKEFKLSNELLNQPIRMLSKGERQRVMLLVALQRKPKLILADEPLDGIDQESRRLIGQYLCKYAKSTNASVLWVSHNLGETLEYADRIFKLKDYSLVEEPLNQYKAKISAFGLKTEEVNFQSLHVLPDLISSIIENKGKITVDIEDSKWLENSK